MAWTWVKKDAYRVLRFTNSRQEAGFIIEKAKRQKKRVVYKNVSYRIMKGALINERLKMNTTKNGLKPNLQTVTFRLWDDGLEWVVAVHIAKSLSC